MKKILNFSLIILGIFTLFFSFNNSTKAQTSPVCKVKNAYFQPAGFQNNGWYDDENKPTVKAVIETENCSGKEVEFSITSTKDNVDTDVAGFDNVDLPIPTTGLLEVTFKAGEDECFQNEQIDCNFYIDLDNSSGGIESDYSSEGKPDGEISYNCDTDILFGIGGVCDENFEFVGVSGGNVKAVWFFFGTSDSDQRGPYDDIAACNQARADFQTTAGNEANSRCFFKLIVENTPPPPTPFPPGTSSYDDTYELLAPIPGVVPGNVVGPDFNLGNYVNNLIKVIIGLAAAMAVFMIVFGGIEWMMSDSFIKKGEGKKRIFDAVKGLVLALGSYLILITINPDLVIVDFRLDKQTIQLQEIADDGSVLTINYSNKSGECPVDCVNLLPEVPIKNSSGKQVEKEVKNRLAKLTQSLSSDVNIAGKWGATEAWQPSRAHKAACHRKGTCIDANFDGLNVTPSVVRSFVTKADAAGLCAIYEVSSAQELNSMLQGGVPSKNVKNYGTWISAPHFSIYGGSC